MDGRWTSRRSVVVWILALTGALCIQQLLPGISDSVIPRAQAASMTFSSDPSAPIFVYEGNSASHDNAGNSLYSLMSQVTGRRYFASSSMPSDLSANACVLLQLNSDAFSDGQIGSMRNYMQGGGVVVGIGEYYTYDPAADDNLNSLTESLGLHMTLEHNALDKPYTETKRMGDSPFAQDVNSIGMATTAGIDLSDPAKVIASTFTEGVPFIASEPVGDGAFVLIGDSNVLSDSSHSGYETTNNGVLANNLCAGAGYGAAVGPHSHRWPEFGYGYSFPNRTMVDYSARSGVPPAAILRPVELSSTFTDWNQRPLVGSRLGEAIQSELEIQAGFGPLSMLWQAMEGGTCYGLALSGGRFADESEPLYSIAQGRASAVWDVGPEPSPSMLLPEPQRDVSSLYDAEFLEMVANDFLTQMSTEVLTSRRAQAERYEQSSGVVALREQLEAAMDGTDLYSSLTGPMGDGFAVLTLTVTDAFTYSHAVLIYGFEQLADGTLKLDVWDNNFPYTPYYVLVYPDGRWSYQDAPYAGAGSARLFGDVYSLHDQPGYARGELALFPLYAPKGLHFFPGSGSSFSVVDVSASSTAGDVQASNGGGTYSSVIAAGVGGYAGETLLIDGGAGTFDAAGDAPSLDVRGYREFMSLSASGPVHVEENTAAGSIGATGAPANLRVARENIAMSSSGATSLSLSPHGDVHLTTDGTAPMRVSVEFLREGMPTTAILYSGSADAAIDFSAQEVLAAEQATSSTPVQPVAPLEPKPVIPSRPSTSPVTDGPVVVQAQPITRTPAHTQVTRVTKPSRKHRQRRGPACSRPRRARHRRCHSMRPSKRHGHRPKR